MIDEVVKRIMEEDMAEAAGKRSRQEETKAYIERFLAQQDELRRREMEAAAAEDKKIQGEGAGRREEEVEGWKRRGGRGRFGRSRTSCGGERWRRRRPRTERYRVRGDGGIRAEGDGDRRVQGEGARVPRGGGGGRGPGGGVGG